MESFLLYIGKSALAAGTFYLLYLALFQHQKHFVFNRIYLPVSLAVSFLIPLITFTTVNYIEPIKTVSTNSFAYLPDVPEITKPEFVYQWFHYLFGFYLLGVVGFLFHLLLGHLKAINIIRFSRLKQLFNAKVNVTLKDVHPFSFFNKIVLSEKTLENPNLEVIVSHEKIHVDEKHTLDILFAEILFLLQWFNPFAWLIKDAIRNNLEYKTDHQITQNNDAEAYQLAMVGLAHKEGVAPFLTALNGSQLKNRIIMMKKKKENKYALLKQLVVLPLLAVLIMGLSNKEVKTEFVQAEKSVEIIVDGKVIPQNHPDLNTVDFTDGIDSEKVIYALHIKHVVATSLDLNGNNPILSIRTSEYIPGSNKEFEENTTKNIVLDGNQLAEKYYYAIDNKIVSKDEFDKQGKTGFENVVFLSGTDAIKKYGADYKGIVADATSGVSNFKISNTSKKEILITGKVTDKDGVPLRNVNVSYTDHKKIINKTLSDNEGNYKIEIDLKDHLLFFRLEGYKSQSFVLEKSEELNVRLEKVKTDEERFMEGLDPKYTKPSEPVKIQGKVTDEKGAPVAGAMVLIKETEIGTVTDKDGNYMIKSESPIEFLMVAKKGFRMPPIEVDGNSVVNIVLETVNEQKPANANDLIIKQVYKVYGKVSDEQGKPIPAATVVVKGKNEGTVTDENGKYALALMSNIDILVFSKPGYQDKKAMLANGELNVQLKEGTAQNTPTQDSNTGAAISNKPTYVKATGSYPSYSNNGSKVVGYGNPGTHSNKITVRSLSKTSNSAKLEFAKGENAPLYILDGIEAKSIENLNPDNVEKITVLKDENATALYGEKGKNGVVIITTKEAAGKKMHNAIVIVDSKKYDGDMDDIDPKTIESVNILKNETATKLYGPAAKDGAIKITTKHNVDFGDKSPLILIDGIPTEKDVNDIDPETIKNIDVLNYASALEKFGDVGKNGVILITTKSADITSEIELRKFIAKNIKYPSEAQKANKEGIAQLFVKVNADGIIYSVSEEAVENAVFVEEVVVVGYKPSQQDVIVMDKIEDHSSVFNNETKLVLNRLPILEVPEYNGKALAITVKFILQ